MCNTAILDEAAKHIEQCVFDISDPQSSAKRKRRAIEWLGYWATELKRFADAMHRRPGIELND